MSELRHMTIDGKSATVAFMTALGGRIVEPDEANVAIARFTDGRIAYYTVGGKFKAAGDLPGHEFHGNQWTSGHAGAPAATVPTPAGAIMDRAALKKTLTDAGYKVEPALDLPVNIQHAIGGMTDATTVPVAAVEGVTAGLKDIDTNVPMLGQLFHDGKIQIVVGNYPMEASATSVNGPEGSWLLVNSSQEAIDSALDPANKDYNVPLKHAAKYEGDAKVRETYRAVMLHEAGHMVDFRVGGALTEDLVTSMMAAGVTQEEAHNVAKDKISSYARDGGAVEAAAEIFAAVMLGEKVDPMFEPMAEQIRGLKALIPPKTPSSKAQSGKASKA